jgi:hypothetical protein
MPVWKVKPVSEAPQLKLIEWSIVEVAGGERHFVGFNTTDHEGRVSSAVVKIDPATMVGVTRSGRVYQLVGYPGHNEDARYVWNAWRRINSVESWMDVTFKVLEELRQGEEPT